jgi:uncharacterized protein (TIGR03067 family)
MCDDIRGTWDTEPTEPEEPPERVYILPYTLYITADTILVGAGFTPLEEFVYRLDPTPDPKHIDLTRRWSRRGELAAQTIKGIYRLEQGRLWFCLGQPGADRPTEFASRPDMEWGLVQLVRHGEQEES